MVLLNEDISFRRNTKKNATLKIASAFRLLPKFIREFYENAILVEVINIVVH